MVRVIWVLVMVPPYMPEEVRERGLMRRCFGE